MKPVTISVSTQKGGVGKTTSVCALAHILARKGLEVGVIDCDPQANTTDILGQPPYERENSISGIMDPDHTLPASVMFTQSRIHKGIHLLPSSISASYDWPQLYSNINRFQGHIYNLLDRVLQKDDRLGELFDVLLIDPPPSLDLPMINALSAADHVIVPLQSGDRFSLSGWKELRTTIQETISYNNSNLSILGILITMHDPRYNVCQTNFEVIHDRYRKEGIPVFDTFISNSVEVKTAHAHRKPITEFNSGHKVSEQYGDLAEEILNRIGGINARTKEKAGISEE